VTPDGVSSVEQWLPTLRAVVAESKAPEYIK